MSENSKSVLLAVETSGRSTSAALFRGGRFLGSHSPDTTGARHARELIPAVHSLLREHQTAPGDVSVVAVSIGPGSFTGLRVGVVFAKTFAWANEARLVAVDTLEAAASGWLEHTTDTDHPRKLIAVADAQRGEFFAADFAAGPESVDLSCTCSVRLVTQQQLISSAAEQGATIVGPGAERLQQTGTGIADIDPFPDQYVFHPTAETVGRIGLRKADRTEWEDADTLEPVYIRRSYAEEKKSANAS